MAGCMCALGGFVAGDRALLRAAGSPRAIEILSDGSAKCLFANGESATLGPGRVTRSWVALPLRAARRRASLLVVAGMLAPNDFRRLRLWARWGRLPDPAALERP